MRKLGRGCFLIIIFIVISGDYIPLSVAAEFNYLGKFCFRMNNIGDYDRGRYLQFDLFSFNGRYYPVHGNVIYENTIYYIPVYGTAVKDGENVIVTLSGTKSTNEHDAFTIHAVFGMDGGEYHTVEQGIRWMQLIPDFIASYSDRGALTPISCP